MESEKVKEIKKALECWQESVMLSTDENYVSHKVYNREILDYINELEKGKENTSYAKGYADGIKNTYEAMLPQKLENFAEKLKESASQQYVSQNGVRISDITYSISDSTINKILKEFI